jgi:hypothetical protein
MRLLILLLAASAGFAQDKPAQDKPTQDKPAQDKPAETKQEPMEAQIIQVKTLTGDSFDRLMKLLGVFSAHVQGDNQLRTILVYAPKDVVAQMRRVVEELDRPGSEAAVGRNIDMTLTFLRCSAKPATPEAVLPPDMETVARQLRSATQYKDIQLWDAVPLRTQEGRLTRETLQLPGTVHGAPATLGTLTIRPEAVYRKDQGRYVRFAQMKLDFRVPSQNAGGGFSYLDVSLDTSGDFMEGQKTVLGKVSGTGEDDAIFAVVTLKVLD